MGNYDLLEGDCLKLLADVPSSSVDMILCDLPYGTTQNKWDTVIPLEPLWAEYWRVCKDNAAVVLTAAQPFTSVLVTSQLNHFKYDWVWRKESGTGHLNAKKMPMRDKEDIVVFCRKSTTYNPQMSNGKPYKAYDRNDGKEVETYGTYGAKREGSPDGKRYPKQVIEFQSVKTKLGKIHPTQKPVALMEYLIRTYTNAGDVVLDNCMGSGTTGVACANTGRKFIGMEQDPTYFDVACERVANAYANSLG